MRPRLLRPLALALAALLPGRPAAAQPAPLAGLDAYVARAMQDWRVPGLAIVVVKDTSVAFMKGYGVRELGKPDPVGVHTRFGAMSTTKAFTALLVAMAADSGRVRLDDRVVAHVPNFELADPWTTREVTVRDLLTHRIGFGDPGFLWSRSGFAYDAIVPRLRMLRPATSLRSRFAYNNVGYALAGDVAARAAGGGATWQTLLRRRILEPLGMSETHADGRELESAGGADVTAPHGIVNDTVRVLPASPRQVDPVAPAGSMYSTASDMARWLRFLLDSGRVDGRRLVSAERFAELFTAQQVVPPDEFYPTMRPTRPHIMAYGLGWFLSDYRGEFVAFHTGSIEGRSAIVGLIPDRRVGVAIFTNLDHAELRHALMYTVFDRYIGPEPRGKAHDWSAEMRAMYAAIADSAAVRRRLRPSWQGEAAPASLPLARYAGTYVDSLYGLAVVGAARDGAVPIRVGDSEGTLEHDHHDVFRLRWRDPFLGDDLVSFVLEPDGTVGELRVGSRRYRRPGGPR